MDAHTSLLEETMQKGPKGEKRPADVIGAAVTVAKVATGEIEATTEDGKSKAAVELGPLSPEYSYDLS